MDGIIAFWGKYQIILDTLFGGAGLVFIAWFSRLLWRKFFGSNDTGSAVEGGNFDQRHQQIRGTQYNAKTINIGVPDKQGAADSLAQKEKESSNER